MVEWKKLGEICDVFAGGDLPNHYIKTNKPTAEYQYPIYSNGIGEKSLYGYSDSYRVNETSITISARGTIGYHTIRDPHFTPIVRLITLIPKKIDSVNLSYLNEVLYMTNIDGTKGGIPQLTVPVVSKITVPVPSLEEQNRIVGILDTFTASIENLKEQITQRRKQFEHYRDQLLDLERKEGVEMNCVAHFVKERILANELTAQNYTSVENLLKDKAGRKDSENVPSDGNWIRYQKGDVLIGNIRPYLRKIWLSDREGGTNGDVIVIRANDALLPEFMFYCLASESFFLYYNQALKDGKMPRGEKNRVLSYVIPSIRIEEQSRIVSILDTFEASIANLEAQLSQREKQYEYYRNKLLTFE